MRTLPFSLALSIAICPLTSVAGDEPATAGQSAATATTVPTTPSIDSPAEAAPSAPTTTVSVAGYLDVYAAWGDTRPSEHDLFFPGAGVAGKRAEELALNFAAVDLTARRGALTARLIAGAGNAMDVLHGGEPDGEGVGRDVLQHLYVASLRYDASAALAFEAGIFPSHIGFEGALPRDNWNYTGSWAANFSPYYQTGVKATYAFAPGWSGELHLLNGWQTVGDVNDGKSVGLRLARSGSRGSIAVNGWIGPELADDESSDRRLLDVVASFAVTPTLDLGAETYVGDQEIPGSNDRARWTTATGYARWRFAEGRYVALRAERFDDPDGGIVGAPQRFDAVTLTYAHELTPGLALRLEGRHDRARHPVFQGASEGVLEREQTLVLLAAMATF